jgi:hypothetical protein
MDFILTALPRSGTSWASVWLMDNALCIHDPFTNKTPEELQAFDPGQRWGIACTAIWSLPSFMKSFNCPYVIIDRNIEEVQTSLRDIGLPPILPKFIEKFDLLPGPRFEHEDLFDRAAALEIWSILRPDMPMNVARWELLCELKIQPDFYKWNPDPAVMRNVLQRLAAEV